MRLFVEPVSILTFEPVTVLATDLVALQPIAALKCKKGLNICTSNKGSVADC